MIAEINPYHVLYNYNKFIFILISISKTIQTFFPYQCSSFFLVGRAVRFLLVGTVNIGNNHLGSTLDGVVYTRGWVQDCSISIAKVLELLQSCFKPSNGIVQILAYLQSDI